MHRGVADEAKSTAAMLCVREMSAVQKRCEDAVAFCSVCQKL